MTAMADWEFYQTLGMMYAGTTDAATYAVLMNARVALPAAMRALSTGDLIGHLDWATDRAVNARPGDTFAGLAAVWFHAEAARLELDRRAEDVPEFRPGAAARVTGAA